MPRVQVRDVFFQNAIYLLNGFFTGTSSVRVYTNFLSFQYVWIERGRRA